MSLIVMNSQDQDPHRFWNNFTDPIKLPRNAKIACQGYSFLRQFRGLDTPEEISGNVIVNEDNDTIAWTLNDVDTQNRMFLPVEYAKFPNGSYYGNNLGGLPAQVQKSMNEAEIVSPYCGGWNVSIDSNKVKFKLIRQEPKNMSAGEWISYGNNNGQVAIQSTVAPITDVADMTGSDISMNYIARSVPTVVLSPGTVNNFNGVFGNPIGGAVSMGFNVIDDDGVNRVNDLIAAVGKNLTVISRDTSIPGRVGTYTFMKILGIAGYVPIGLITNATHIEFNVQVISQNLNVPNPPYPGNPFNWFSTEPLTLIFSEEPDPQETTLYPQENGLDFVNKKPLWNVDNTEKITDISAGDNVTGVGGIQGYRFELKPPANQPKDKLQCLMGITTQDMIDLDRNNELDANSDWSRLQSRVVYGVRVDSNAELIVCKSRIAKLGELQPNTTEFSQTATGVTCYDASGNVKNMKIMMRPIYDNGYKLEILYNKDNQTDYTSLDTLEVTDADGDYPIYHKLHLYQVASFENKDCFPLETKAIHHLDVSGASPNVACPTKKALGFGYEGIDYLDTENLHWLGFMNRHANCKALLGFTNNSYSVGSGDTLESDYVEINESSFTNPAILVNVLGLPAVSFVGSANMGQQSTTIAVASTDNEAAAQGYNTRQIYKHLPYENWIHLRNEQPMTVTRLGINLTDVELKKIDCLEKSSTIWLKVSGDDERSYKMR